MAEQVNEQPDMPQNLADLPASQWAPRIGTQPDVSGVPDEALCQALQLECQRIGKEIVERFHLPLNYGQLDVRFLKAPVDAEAALRLFLDLGVDPWKVKAMQLTVLREQLAATLHEQEQAALKPQIALPQGVQDAAMQELLADLHRQKRNGHGGP